MHENFESVAITQKESAASTQKSGYVYVLSNPSMPGIIKVGLTSGDVSKRAEELQGTGIPTPFQVELALHVPDCRKLEKIAHREFCDYRVKGNREFFSMPVETARDELFRLVDGEFTNNEFFDALYEAELKDMEADFDANYKRYRKQLEQFHFNRKWTYIALGVGGGILFSLLMASIGGKL